VHAELRRRALEIVESRRVRPVIASARHRTSIFAESNRRTQTILRQHHMHRIVTWRNAHYRYATRSR
jgi:hypothetical protein